MKKKNSVNYGNRLLLAILVIGLGAGMTQVANASGCCGTGSAPEGAAAMKSGHSMDKEHALGSEAWSAYLEIQEALAADTLEGVSEKASLIAEKTEVESAEKLAEAGGLEAARKAFLKVSKDFISSAKEHGLPEGQAIQAHCPMAFDDQGAYWIQAEEPLANPYFGASMLRCGSIEEAIGEEKVSEDHSGHDH